MDIDIDLFMRMLSIDSTSSKERGFADFLEKEFGSGKCTVSRFEVGDGTVNLLEPAPELGTSRNRVLLASGYGAAVHPPDCGK